jgi:hypothetical protein
MQALGEEATFRRIDAALEALSSEQRAVSGDA